MDRAALDVALELHLDCGGWCPAGRWAEDGHIPPHYPLQETASSDPAERTRANVHESDATLILHGGSITGGTRLALRTARRLGRPAFAVNLQNPGKPRVGLVREWLVENRVHTLNVAGPRESESPGIYGLARDFLLELLGDVGYSGQTGESGSKLAQLA